MNHKKLLFLLSFGMLLQGQAQEKRKYVNEFLHLGVGARQLGMGKAGVTSVNDVYAGYWNPAALPQIENNLQLGFMHNFYFQNIANYDFLGIAAKAGENKAFSLCMVRFGVDGILNTLDLIQNGEIRYDKVTEFSAVDYAFMPSFGKTRNHFSKWDLDLSWGGSLKLIHRRVGNFARAWGFGIDGAVRLEDKKRHWGLTAVMRDMTSTYNNWSFEFTQAQKNSYYINGQTIPVSSLEVAKPRVILGGFKRFETDKYFALGEANFDITMDGKRNTLISSYFLNTDARIGVEGGVINEEKGFQFALRMGVYNFQHEVKQNGKKGMTVQPTIGAGVQFDQMTIDYALAGFGGGGTGLYSNIISLRFNIDKISKKKSK